MTKPCLVCGDLTATGSYCPQHRQERTAIRDLKRGTTTQRGYGKAHQRERARWARIVQAGQAFCCRCGKWLPPGSPFDLDHNPRDPTRATYLGVACPACNRGAQRVP